MSFQILLNGLERILLLAELLSVVLSWLAWVLFKLSRGIRERKRLRKSLKEGNQQLVKYLKERLQESINMQGQQEKEEIPQREE